MTEQNTQIINDNEISLLDILVVLAESWKLLIYGPLLSVALAIGVGFLWPKTFESVAILRLAEEEVALLHATPVLDPLIEKFGLLAEADGVMDVARHDLRQRLIFAVDKKTKYATITVKARESKVAQALSNSAIAAVLKELQVKGREKALIEKTIAINIRVIENLEDAIESIQRSLKRQMLSEQSQESTIKNLTVINSEIAKRSQENEELRQKLEPKGSEVIVQEPSLPQREVSPKRGLIIFIAIFLSSFVLLTFVFVRKAWASVKKKEEAIQKIALIKKALQIK
jgi:hypothetical protein